MKLHTYKYRDNSPHGWKFPQVEFSSLNLLVGNTATGKSRFLNTIFNLGRFVVSKESMSGQWEIQFLAGETTYYWKLTSINDGDGGVTIKSEELTRKSSNGKTKTLVKRDANNFLFNNDKLPKLSKSETSITLLKEEDDIQPLYYAFQNMKRRLFSVEAASRIFSYDTIPDKAEETFKGKGKLKDLFRDEFALNVKFYLLQKYHRNAFDRICKAFIEVFPFVNQITVRDAKEIQPLDRLVGTGRIPVLSLKESGVTDDILLHDLSSGMKKVLLFLTDICTMPKDTLYLVDEYENSLGINAIDFFPEFIVAQALPQQFIFTSHHPYIINKIPIKNWFVFRRKGSNVDIKYGEELIKRYGKSKQTSFIQLINDSFFIKGVQ